MKTCMKCGGRLPLTEFYKHPKMADGRLGKCKTCTKRDVRENRRKRAEYYREYDRQRAMRPDRVKMREDYLKTESGKEARARALARDAERRPNAAKANNALGNAVRDGRIERPNRCEDCGALCTPQGHHDDYAKPLDVRWLCPGCHKQWHDTNGPGLNGDNPEATK